MVDRVLSAVGAAVMGIVQELAALRRMRIFDDVVVLKIVGGGPDRQIVVDVWLPPENALHLRQELRGVPITHRAPQLEWDVGSIEILERGAKLARRVDRHLRRGELAQLVADGPKVGLDLSRLAFARGRELVVDRLLQGVAGPQVAQHAGEQHRDRPEQREYGEKLRGQPPPRRAGRGGGIGRRHGTFYSISDARA